MSLLQAVAALDDANADIDNFDDEDLHDAAGFMISDAELPPARCDWLWRRRWLSRWLSPYRAVQPIDRAPQPSRCRTALQVGCALVLLAVGLGFLGFRAPSHKPAMRPSVTLSTTPSIKPSFEPCATDMAPTEGASPHPVQDSSSTPHVLSSPPTHNSIVLFLADDLQYSGSLELHAPTPMRRARNWLAAQGVTATNFFAHCEPSVTRTNRLPKLQASACWPDRSPHFAAPPQRQSAAQAEPSC